MFATLRTRRLFPVLTVVILLGGASSAAIAADASRWDDDLQSSARLIAAQVHNDAGGRVFRAGLEIKLKEGWKTYWRYPGDSGVPPVFDFSKSRNVKSVTVLYPAPSRFPDGAGGNSIGYKGLVVLPLRVVPQDAAKPVMLNLKLAYAACEKLCIPAEANLELEISGTETANESVLAAAEQRVPKVAHIGTGTPAIQSVKRETSSGKPRVIVDVATAGDAPVTVFAEGPTGWALPLPEPVAGAPAGAQRFVFEVDGLPAGEKPDGATLKLTAIAGDKAVEVAFRLD